MEEKTKIPANTKPTPHLTQPIQEYEYLSLFLEYLYLNIVEGIDYKPSNDPEVCSIIDKMLQKPIGLKSKRTVYRFKELMERGEKCGVNVIFPPIMCRHHLKKLNRSFKLGIEDITELYYYVCDMIILEYNRTRKLIPIISLINFPDIIEMYKKNPMLSCSQCKENIDTKVKDRYYITIELFGKCHQCNGILCKNCMDTHNHLSVSKNIIKIVKSMINDPNTTIKVEDVKIIDADV